MAIIKWRKVCDQNLAYAVRDAGFDLSVYEKYSSQTRKDLRERAVSSAISLLRESYRNQAGRDLGEVKRGIYVISVSKPFTLKYKLRNSPVIYIGRGSVINRLKSNYHKNLFDFMMNISGVNFDFHISEPRRKNSSDYYKHVEHLLLSEFAEKFGGGTREFPLLNKNSAKNLGLGNKDDGWRKPLNTSGSRRQWILEPTVHFKELDS